MILLLLHVGSSWVDVEVIGCLCNLSIRRNFFVGSSSDRMCFERFFMWSRG